MVIAPIPEDVRRLVEEIVGRPCTDADVVAWQQEHGCECRELPLKAAVLQAIAIDALSLVEELVDAGVEFAGTVSQAAATVTGTIYAAWRAGLREGDETEPAMRHAAPFQAVRLAIDHARRYVDGMPAMYRDDFIAAIADSDDPVDQMSPIDVLAELWPERFGDRRLGPQPGQRANAGRPSRMIEQMTGNAPNILFGLSAAGLASVSEVAVR